jgi:hypothetical protein
LRLNYAGKSARLSYPNQEELGGAQFLSNGDEPDTMSMATFLSRQMGYIGDFVSMLANMWMDFSPKSQT